MAIIVRYLWGKELNLWHLYCGLSPICLFIKKTVIYTGCEGGGDPKPHTSCVTPSPGDEPHVWVQSRHCREAERISASLSSLPWIFIMFWIIYFTNVGKNIVCRVKQRSRLPLHTGDVSVDTWARPSELPEFPSLAFAEKTAVDRLPVRNNLFPSECRRHWSRQ